MGETRRSTASKRHEEVAPPAQAQSKQPVQTKASVKPVVEKKQSKGLSAFNWFTIFMLFASFIVIALLPKDFTENYVIGERHPVKNFHTFSQFYPFYLTEHSDVTNRILHFIGTSLVLLTLILDPVLLHCVMIAGCFGYLACTIFAGDIGGPKLSQTGALEALTFLFVFFFFAIGNKRFKKAIFILILGYAFAWFGHFNYEHNKPATFIYPTYSLMSDLKMWLDMALHRVPGLDQFSPVITELAAPAINKLQPVITVVKPYYMKVVDFIHPYYLHVHQAASPYVAQAATVVRPYYHQAKEFVLQHV